MIVAKFGGTPMADSNNVNKVIRMILHNKQRKIIVVSAPGARFKGDKKVTDLLIEAADPSIDAKKRKKHIDEIIARFSEIAKGTGADVTLTVGALEDLVTR
ncbi:MAG TPA: aspartate kinase, partial [bacterium]|nr:aspartate kinase [bacterium]